VFASELITRPPGSELKHSPRPRLATVLSCEAASSRPALLFRRERSLTGAGMLARQPQLRKMPRAFRTAVASHHSCLMGGGGHCPGFLRCSSSASCRCFHGSDALSSVSPSRGSGGPLNRSLPCTAPPLPDSPHWNFVPNALIRPSDPCSRPFHLQLGTVPSSACRCCRLASMPGIDV